MILLFFFPSRFGIICGGQCLVVVLYRGATWEERPSGCFFPPRRTCTFFSARPHSADHHRFGILEINTPRMA